MTVPVLFRRAAELDLVAIEDWYDAQRQGLGREFRQPLDAVIGRLSEHPLAYEERYRGARRAVLHRFPYVLWYRVTDNVVVVLACVHGSRHPGAIRGRLRESG